MSARRSKAVKAPPRLKVGDIVCLTWTDVHGYERSNVEEMMAIGDPAPTLSFGIVVKLNPQSVVIAHELSDLQSSGHYPAVYPSYLIQSVEVLGHKEVTL